MLMVELEDVALSIRESQDGHLEAFEVVVARYQKMVHSLAYRKTGSASDADDLAQEVFIKVFHHLPSFRGEAKFSSWLYRVAVNVCLNWKKAHAHRDQTLRNWQAEMAAEVNSPEPPPAELIRRVELAVLRLPLKQRAAVVLTTYEGMNHAEAARVLGCSETTVSWRLCMARRKLKNWLKSR